MSTEIIKNLKTDKLKPNFNYLGLSLGGLLISLSLWLGGIDTINGWLAQGNTPVRALTNNVPPVTSTPLIIGTPERIAVPAVNISLKIIPGYYNPDSQSWTLSLTDAQWGVMTAKPNNKSGSTFIYAHARQNVFSELPKVKPGDEAIVSSDNGHTFTYRFISSVETVPTDTSLFDYNGKPILVLQTCSGLWYQYRQLFTFDLVKIDGEPVAQPEISRR